MAPVYGPQSMAHASDNAVSHTMATGEGHGTAAVEALKRAATGSAFKSVVVDKVRTLWLALWLPLHDPRFRSTLQINRDSRYCVGCGV